MNRMNLLYYLNLGDHQSADQKVQTLSFNPQVFVGYSYRLLALKGH